MPLGMIGEHAQEDMGTHARCGPMADRADIEIDGLQAAEGPLDAGQVLVGLQSFIRIELPGRHGCADHVDAVETGLLFVCCVRRWKAKWPSRISTAKCLAILRLFTTPPTAMPISAAPGNGEHLRRTCAWMRSSSRSVAASNSSRLRARSAACL